VKRLGFKTYISTCGRIISWLIKRGEESPFVLKGEGERGVLLTSKGHGP